MLSHLKKETMHHAFVIEGDLRKTRGIVFDFLRKELDMDIGHSDVVLLDRGDFGIDNVQEIIDINSRKPIKGMYKVIVIVLHSITHQAQNAMLKTLEEPRPGTFIFILTNTSAIFLPTILSRVQVIRGNDAMRDDNRALQAQVKSQTQTQVQSKKDIKKNEILSAKVFIKNSKSERLAQIKKILDLKADEEIGDSEIFGFIQELEKVAYEASSARKDAGRKQTQDNAEDRRFAIVQVFTKIEEYMRDTSSSKKLLLEYMALRLPVF
jgi:DNA polymerase III delta prime subunit